MTQKHNPDQAMAAMLKRKGVWPRAAGAECPDEGILAAYFDRSLRAAEVSRWETHFSLCARCQEQLAALARSEPPTQAGLAPGATRGFGWLWNWRFLAPVGAVAVVLLGFLISQQTLRAPTATPTGELVARRDVTPPTASAPEPLNSVAPAQLEKGRATRIELKDNKRPVGESQAQAQRPLNGRENVSGAVALSAPAKSLSADARVTVAAAPSAPPAPPPSEALAETEAAKPQRRIVEADRPQAAPSQADKVAVQSIQEKERAAHLAEQKANANQATPAVQLKRESATQEGAGYRQRAGAGIVGGVPRKALLAAPGEFIVNTPNPKILWRFGASGLIERSRDAGKTWERQKNPAQDAFLAGSAPSEKVCWAGGKNGVLVRTTDGGETWEAVLSPTQSDIVAVKALDHLHATLTYADGRSFETPNAGRLWRMP